MAALYPSSVLPPPVRDGFTAKHQSPYAPIEMDDGHTRARRQFSAQPARFELTWTLTWRQLAIFEAFMEYGVEQASGWFTLPLFGDQPAVDVRLVEGYSTNYNAQAGTWKVTGEAETLFASPVLAPAGLPAWPEELPWPEQEGYGFSTPGAPLRSQNDRGLADVRVRFQDRLLQYRVTCLLDKAQKIVFDAFYRDTLIHGAAWFSAPFANGLGTATVRARFMGEVVVASFGAAYKLSATLGTTGAPRMSFEDYVEAVGRQSLHRFFDQYTVSAPGAIEYQDFADDYFAQDYVGTRGTFS